MGYKERCFSIKYLFKESEYLAAIGEQLAPSVQESQFKAFINVNHLNSYLS